MQLNKTTGATRRRRSEQKMVRQEEERAALHCKRGQYSELRSNVSVVSHEMSVSSGDSTSYENGPSAQQTGGR